LFREDTRTTSSPKRLAFMRAPTKIEMAQKATWKVVRGPMSLPVRRSVCAWREVKY